MAITLPFKGNKVVPVKNLVFPEIGPLSGDFGKQVLDEYNGRVAKDYGNADALKVLKYADGVVKGSNPFAVVLMNSILPTGLRTASQADLEEALQGDISFNGTYEDTGLVLRTDGNPNAYLAKNLTEQLRARGKRQLKYPVMIPLNQFSLVTDASSDQGLAFKLNEDAQVFYAPILNQNTGNFKDIDPKTGLPTKLGEGSRTFYTRKDGLSWLFLDRISYLYSNGDCLAGSGESGRVLVRTASGSSNANEILQEYSRKIEAEVAQKVEAIQRKGKEALAVLHRK